MRAAVRDAQIDAEPVCGTERLRSVGAQLLHGRSRSKKLINKSMFFGNSPPRAKHLVGAELHHRLHHRLHHSLTSDRNLPLYRSDGKLWREGVHDEDE